MKAPKEQKPKATTKNCKRANIESVAAKTEKTETESKRTIKQVVIEIISANKAVTNEEMIAAVRPS